MLFTFWYIDHKTIKVKHNAFMIQVSTIAQIFCQGSQLWYRLCLIIFNACISTKIHLYITTCTIMLIISIACYWLPHINTGVLVILSPSEMLIVIYVLLLRLKWRTAKGLRYMIFKLKTIWLIVLHFYWRYLWDFVINTYVIYGLLLFQILLIFLVFLLR